jgi:hypothetical protein
MRIVFSRGPDRVSSEARIERPDGLVVVLPSTDRRHRVPHDVAHAATERELGMPDGVFGSIASGAMFKGMRVLSGRQRHDAAARSRRILRANRRSITVAEVLTGIVHDAVEAGRRAPFALARRFWGTLEERPFPWTEADLARAAGTLRDLAARWEALAPGDGLELGWPDRLVMPVPAEPRGSKPQPRRR